MLFISRYIGKNNYGVVDSETGVEQTYSFSDIEHRCLNSSFDIKGVTVGYQQVSKDLGFMCVEEIRPYQPIDTMTVLQTKLGIMQHVCVTVYNGSITSVRWDSDRIKSPVSVRLSDFGVSCADCFLYGNKDIGRHKVTLVLDSGVCFCQSSFLLKHNAFEVGPGGIGVVFDVHELSDAAARVVYDALYYIHGRNVVGAIADSPERSNLMQYMLEERASCYS